MVAGVCLPYAAPHSYYVQTAKGQSLYYDFLLLALEALFLESGSDVGFREFAEKRPEPQVEEGLKEDN